MILIHNLVKVVTDFLSSTEACIFLEYLMDHCSILLARIQNHCTSDQPGVQMMVVQLEELVRRIDAGLAEHLEKCGVEFMQFVFYCMNRLLLREFELRCVIP